MNPRVIGVEVKSGYTLQIAFENDEIRLFDATPFLEKGVFNEYLARLSDIEELYRCHCSCSFGELRCV